MTADTEVIPSGAGVAPIYGAVQKLRFNIHEYLKGAGPGQADIIVRGYDTYPDEAMASQVAQAVMANRVTTWDDQEAVLFLNATTPPQTGAQPAQVASNGATFEFTTSNYSVQSDWDYSIDTLSRAWLPAVGSQTPAQQPSGQTGTGAGSQSAPAASFITDGSLSPTPATSIDELRSKIAEITAMENVSSSYEYAVCLDNKIKRERYFRDEPVIDWEIEDSIESGSAPGSTIHTAEFTSGGPEYYIPWVNGPDAALFKTSIEDDDSDPTNGSEYALTIARPLPAGQYRVFHHMQHWENVICDFWPDNVYDDWTITVTAPGGTLHEALFDPVATGLATGVEGGSGSLDPAGFTVDNTAVTITKLLWQAGSVILTMSPFNPLAGHSIEFIDIDGAVSLTLNMGDATADRAAGTLTWTVTKKPWKGADQLMLRISKP